MQRSEDRRGKGVEIPNTARGLEGATILPSLFEGVNYSPEETLSMNPTYPPNQIASQNILGTGLSENLQIMSSPLDAMKTSELQSMSLSPESVVVAGVGAISPSMALGPPKKAVTKKKKKGKKKKDKKKKGGYKKRRSTVRRSTKRRSKKPTLKRRTQRKKK